MPPVAKLIGFELVELKKGEALFPLHADERHVNPMGTLHGGVLCDVSDESGQLVAHATSTCMTLRGEKAQGR